MNRAFWDRVLEARTAIGKQLEVLRKAGSIGSTLDAEVAIYADAETLALLGQLGDELRFVLISSAARLHSLADAPADALATELAGIKLGLAASAHGKCVRCWHHRADVGSHAEHPELCGRCVENVVGAGEQRRFA